MSFQSKSSQVLSRQLEAQSLIISADLVAATSDLPAVVSIDNSTIADTLINIALGENVAKVFQAHVTNQATGAVVPLEALPDLSVDNIVTLQVNGTALTTVSVHIIYKIEE